LLATFSCVDNKETLSARICFVIFHNKKEENERHLIEADFLFVSFLLVAPCIMIPFFTFFLCQFLGIVLVGFVHRATMEKCEENDEEMTGVLVPCRRKEKKKVNLISISWKVSHETFLRKGTEPL
jgi:hypothetical protein